MTVVKHKHNLNRSPKPSQGTYKTTLENKTNPGAMLPYPHSKVKARPRSFMQAQSSRITAHLTLNKGDTLNFMTEPCLFDEIKVTISPHPLLSLCFWSTSCRTQSRCLLTRLLLTNEETRSLVHCPLRYSFRVPTNCFLAQELFSFS